MESNETATLGGGCFWCLEAAFERLDGVRRVRSGYAGGRTPAPTYEQVCSGTTGHAEVVQIDFDPEAISFRDLLEVFFAIHDPTTLNRQGADVGTQYRSVIFTHSAEQAAAAHTLISSLEAGGTWSDPIVTEVSPYSGFHPAEAAHDRYFARNPAQPYCQVVIAPKIAKFETRFGHRIGRSS